MAKIIQRWASDDIDAFQTAQGMENAGASVFSITHNGMELQPGARKESSKFIVWAKYDEPLTADMIDDAVCKVIYGDNYNQENGV